MIGEYVIHFGDTSSGTAFVEKEGMFWRIRCCTAPTQVPCRMEACWGEHCVDLGICAPMGGSFGLTVRLNRKNVPPGRPVFRLKVISRGAPQGFVPICADEPFAYIARLKQAYLVRWDGKCGVVLPDQKMESPTGQ